MEYFFVLSKQMLVMLAAILYHITVKYLSIHSLLYNMFWGSNQIGKTYSPFILSLFPFILAVNLAVCKSVLEIAMLIVWGLSVYLKSTASIVKIRTCLKFGLIKMFHEMEIQNYLLWSAEQFFKGCHPTGMILSIWWSCKTFA